ncbi:MAG: hypothetical protein R3Y36_08375 [Spirochaetales bacterium]
MVSLIVGILFCGFTVIAALPSVLGWGPEILLFLKGFAPCFAGFVGIIAIFIGIADLKDKSEAKKEEALSKSLNNE